VISSLILGIMRRRPGISFCDPQRQVTTTRTKDGFVDDVTALANQFLASLRTNHHRIEQIAIELEAMAQQWEQLLHSTGGALELSKCFYYLGRPANSHLSMPAGVCRRALSAMALVWRLAASTNKHLITRCNCY
jgi:hypothetical protein